MSQACHKRPATLCSRLHNLQPGFAVKSAAMKRFYRRAAHQVVPFSLQLVCHCSAKLAGHEADYRQPMARPVQAVEQVEQGFSLTSLAYV
jgi:hypothetical protein